MIPERNQSGAPKQSKVVSIPQIPVSGGYNVLCNGRVIFLYLHMWSKNGPPDVPSRANLARAEHRHMPNKRKADAAPDGAGAPKVGRGGGGRGAGRKRKPENAPGADATGSRR